MPVRMQAFYNDGLYHIFNKTIHLDAFSSIQAGINFLALARYYKSKESKISYSTIQKMERRERSEVLSEIFKPEHDRVKIISHAIMPNHFHFLIEQVCEGGVVQFVSNITNSFTKSYNLKNDLLGPLFLPRFKAVEIKSEEQLLHTSRYIHLNHTTSNLISKNELLEYPLNSFREYISNPKGRLSDDSRILGIKPTKGDREHYKNFVFSRIKHQQDLSLVKELE